MDDPAEYLRQKTRQYDSLAAVDDEDDVLDAGLETSRAILKKASKQQVKHVLETNGSRSLARSASDNGLVQNNKLAYLEDALRPPSSPDPRKHRTSVLSPGNLKKSASDIPPPTKTSAKVLRKRKQQVEEVVTADGLFTGLHLFFFPNNDVHPARKMRISKAVAFGAVWHKNWNDEVTHVVLDRGMELSNLTRFLDLDILPRNITVVSENYVADCISFKSTLDPKLPRFAVKGLNHPASTKVIPSDSAKSLPVEPAKRSTAKQRMEIPPKENVMAVPATASELPRLSDKPDVASAKDNDTVLNALEMSEELNEAIQKAKALEHVPLDEDDRDTRPDSSEDPDWVDEEQQPDFKLLTKRNNKRKQDKFQCMEKHTGENSESPNLTTINTLQQMADYYDQIGDQWRTRAYRKAIGTLRNHPSRVTTKEEALALPNIGGRLATKIEEIAITNSLRRLESARAEPGDRILQTFMQVYGAGVVQARRWVEQGYKSLDELLEKAPLTDNQRIGIERYDDFNSRIPREQVEQHGNIVRNALRKIDPALEVIIGGSYRRGARHLGDIDCIITRPDTNADHLRNVVLGQLIPQLTAQKFFVASFAITSLDDGSKWHGASCLPGSKIWRRLDLLLVPSDEIGAALIYWTGNDIFNRSLRLLASTKGMRLNQRGLYSSVMRGWGRVKLTDGTLIEGKDEKHIFEVLGVPWRPPEHRVP